jgi:prepilin-type N-terminal cleavage/methylation domain-containing protein
MSTRPRGFTLLELMLALSIVAVLMVIVSGGLRIGLTAWQRGEERTARLDRDRSLLFEGHPDRITFATLSPPLPTAAPAAFSVVSLAADPAGLALRQQILPSPVPLDRVEPLLVDAHTSGLRFRYLGQEAGSWEDVWDLTREDSLPRAVEITLVSTVGSRSTSQTITVPIPASGP